MQADASETARSQNMILQQASRLAQLCIQKYLVLPTFFGSNRAAMENSGFQGCLFSQRPARESPNRPWAIAGTPLTRTQTIPWLNW